MKKDSRIRIKLKSYDSRIIDLSCEKIIDTAVKLVPRLLDLFLYLLKLKDLLLLEGLLSIKDLENSLNLELIKELLMF